MKKSIGLLDGLTTFVMAEPQFSSRMGEGNHRHFKNLGRQNWLAKMIAVIGIVVALLGVQSAQAFINPIAVNFNAPGELTGSFNDGYGSPSWSQNTSGGIAGGGGITIPNNSSDLYICQQGFPMQVGATYTVGAYFYNYYNSGYGGLGFTTLTSGTINGGQCTPLSAIGVSIHGGGGFMDNNSASTPATTSVNWDAPINPGEYYWFYYKVTLTCTSANTFSQTMEIWQCDTNGNLGTKRTTTTVTGQVNASLGAATSIYPFFGAALSRFTAVDSFTATTTIPNPTMTWSGASGTGYNWNTSGNWVEGAVPATGDNLVFPTVSAGRYNTTNNISGLTLHSMTFTAGGYANSGNAVSLSAGVTNSSGAPARFNCPLTLTADQTFNMADHFVFTGNLTNNFALTVNSAVATTVAFNGIVSGTGTIGKAGSGFLNLTGNNTHIGSTTVNGGDLYLSGNNTTNAGPTTVNGGVMFLSGNNNYSDLTTVNGGALVLSGNNNHGGPTMINAGGTLELDGSIAADSVITIASGAELTTCSPYYGYYTNNSTAAGTVAVYGRLFPGVYPVYPNSYPNTLNTGSETWYGGTHNSDGYVVTLNGNLAGTPGVDWPCLNITGTLNIAATSDHPFAIWPSCTWVFNNVQDYTWPIATASGGITGFDASKFTIRMDNIAGAWPGGLGGGQFIVTQSGNDVNLQFFHVVAHPVTAYRAFGTSLSLPVATVLANVSGGTGSYTLTGVTSRSTNDYVQISGPNILFAPADPNATSSTLDYFVQPVAGVPAYTNSGVLTVIATNVAGISQSVTVSGGTRMVSLAGVPSSQFMVQRSTNLTDWVNMDGSSGATNSICTACTNGLWNFTDPNPPKPSAYYRTVQAYVSVIWGGLNPTYDGTPKSVTATFSPPGTAVNITYNGSSTPPTDAGSYTVVGTISNGSYSGSATNTLTIAKATAMITVADDGLYDGQATTTTSPSGLTVILNYVILSGIYEAPNVTFGVTATISDSNYAGVAYGTAMYFWVANQ